MTVVRTRTPSGEAIVILPEVEFERLVDLAEDALDARALDASLSRPESGAQELLSEDDLDALRAAPTPLSFWRERRGLTVGVLARDCAVAENVLVEIERGERMGDADLYGKLAAVLDVDVEDIQPDDA